MKKKLIFISIAFIIILLLFFISSYEKTKNENIRNKLQIYSFSGENKDIIINNGLVVITDDIAKFIGGDLSFKDKEFLDVKDYFLKFFFYKNKNEDIILDNGGTMQSKNKGLLVPGRLGEISSKNLFTENDLKSIEQSLMFSLNGTLMNGKVFEYYIKLDVKKVLLK